MKTQEEIIEIINEAIKRHTKIRQTELDKGEGVGVNICNIKIDLLKSIKKEIEE